MSARNPGVIDSRAVAPTGPNVHVYDFGGISQAILFRDRLIECQRVFDTVGEARPHGRRLADWNGCPVIEHRSAT
ncbi:MAG: hypothetical protein O9296_04540 [Novosphingobium sp.]|jgi:hypothetical protein|nr:hypothetical protein [Novosphingobium sp.]